VFKKIILQTVNKGIKKRRICADFKKLKKFPYKKSY
jgi:hypothetical protein